MGNIKTVIENNTIINSTTPEVIFKEVLLYISKNIESWKNNNVIWDLNNFCFETLTREDIQSYIFKSKTLSEKRAGQKTALVAESDLNYGMIRMWSLLGEYDYQFEIQAFRTLSEAEEWFKN